MMATYNLDGKNALLKAVGKPIKLDISKLVWGRVKTSVKPFRLPNGDMIAVPESKDDAIGYCKYPRDN